MVADSRRLGLEGTEQVGRVDRDDSYKDGNPGDRDIHPGMNGKPPAGKAVGLYFFSDEECSSGFFPEKEAKRKLLFFLLLARRNSPTRGPNGGKYDNLMEIISDLNVLIAAYEKLKSKPGNPGWDPAVETLGGISL